MLAERIATLASGLFSRGKAREHRFVILSGAKNPRIINVDGGFAALNMTDIAGL